MNAMYLNLPIAIQRIGDAELVDEMLVMLHQSLPEDWQSFIDFMRQEKLIEAEKIIHQLKGTIPFFSDGTTADLLQHMDVLLKNATNKDQIHEKFTALQSRMHGFQVELDDWFCRTHA